MFPQLISEWPNSIKEIAQHFEHLRERWKDQYQWRIFFCLEQNQAVSPASSVYAAPD